MTMYIFLELSRVYKQIITENAPTKVFTYCRREAQFHQVISAVSVSIFVISQSAVLRSLHQCILTATRPYN